MPVTIRDIARKCKVSAMTVSRVINNKGNIKEETRQKVLQVIKQEKYDPFENNPLARQQKQMTIGFMSPQLREQPDPFISRGLSAAQSCLLETDYNCVLYAESQIAEMTARGLPRDRSKLNCDGLVFFCPFEKWDQYLTVIRQWDIPVVLIRRKTAVTGITTIHDNDYKGAQLAMAYLAGLGHRSIGFVSKRLMPYLHERRQGYLDYVKEHDLTCDDRLVYNYSLDQIKNQQEQNLRLRAWAKEILASPLKPTAFFCSDDTEAIWLIYYLKDLGVRVPEDIAVVGYNNDTSIDIVDKILTTVNIPVREMVQLAYKKLFERFDGIKVDKVDIEVANELVVRESCGAKGF